MGSGGFAAIPTAAIDPPPTTASPAVPALSLGPGPQAHEECNVGTMAGNEILDFSALLRPWKDILFFQRIEWTDIGNETPFAGQNATILSVEGLGSHLPECR